MTKRSPGKALSRRHFFRLTGGGAVVAAGAGLLPFKKLLGPLAMSEAEAQSFPAPDLFFAGTDGWMSLPKSPSIFSASLGVYTHPDDLAPGYPVGPLTTYIFGFRNVTWLDAAQRAAQKNHAQHNAPIFWVDQFDPDDPKDFRVQLTNLGLAQRPDLFDAHTIHWHGFRNVITFFDGEPTGSVAVTTGRIFQYIYRPRDPGTYMFHCHVEDVEHVHMGMTGPVWVRPLQNGNTTWYPSGKYRLQRRRRLDRLRPRVPDVLLRGLGRLALGRRAHPAAGVERLPCRLLPAERAGLPRHARAQCADRRPAFHPFAGDVD